MQPHTAEKVDDLLSNHLPVGYSKIIVDDAAIIDVEISSSGVRQVKNLIRSNIKILNLLIKLAKDTKADAEAEHNKLKKLTS